MEHKSEAGQNAVHMPAPTAWPIALALGLTLVVTGMVTSAAISVLGLLLVLAASVGWFRQVLPVEAHEMVEAPARPIEIASARKSIDRLPVSPMHRKMIPVETFQVTTGLKGGVAGGIAMIVPATAFSLIKYHSLWYATNLMAAGGFVNWADESNTFLAQFHMQGLLAALAIHVVTSLLVGLLYGAMLPMFPRWPILTAGIIAPLMWSGVLYPTLQRRQPHPECAHRLALVHPFADGLWPCMRLRCQPAGQSPYGAVSGAALCRARRTPWRIGRTERRDQKRGRARMRSWFQIRSVLVLRHSPPSALGVVECRAIQSRGKRSLAPVTCWILRHSTKQNCAGCHGEDGQNGAALP